MTTHPRKRASISDRFSASHAVQPLEARRMLASAAIAAGELLVIGDGAKSNAINVDLSTDKTKYTVTIGSSAQSFEASGVIAVRVIGGSQNDSLTLDAAATVDSVFEPGAGNDTVNGGAGSDNVFDPSGSNVFNLNGGDDYASGGTGGDTINGGDGNDVAFGNAGADRFNGGSGNDTFDGGDGNDSADGGSGTDITLSTETRTTVEYHPGLAPNVPTAAKSTLSGGTLTVSGLSSGINVISITNASGTLTVAAGATRTTFATNSVSKIIVNGGSAADFISIDSALAIPASINGGGGDDTIISAGGNDTINGGDGNDRINTQGGSDFIVGGTANDLIESGSGNDTVTGDAGTDRVDGGAGSDTVSTVEYNTGVEHITTTNPNPPTPPVVVPPVVNPPTTPPGGPTNPSASTPSPVITAISKSLTAGQSLFVNGLSSSYGNGSQDTAHFEWDFGDAGSAYNSLVGFSAGHVYQKAGTYTVTLKLWNERMGFKQTSITVNVSAAGRSAIFVSGSGSDSNSGTSSGSAVKTAARAFAMAKGKSNVDILFDGGDTFSVSNALLIGGSNVRVGSYGSGKGTLKWTGPRNGNAILTIVRGSVGCIVENLNFDDIYPGPSADRSGIPVGVDVIGSQTTIRNLTFLNIGYAIQTNKLPTGVLVQNCDSPNLYGLRNYLVWCQGSDFVILGNKVVNSTNEHPIRVFGVDRLLIAYNDLANPQAYGWETSKTAMNVQKGNDVYIYGNTLRGPRMQVGPLGGADGINDKGARLTDVVIENNTMQNTIVQMYTGAQNVYFRNNIWSYSNNDAITLEGYSSTYGRGISNVNIINNTFVNNGTEGGVIQITGSVAGVKVINNLYKAPSLSMGSKGTAAIYAVDMSAFNSFTSITNNIWAVPASYPTWLSSHTTGKVFALIGVNQAEPNNYYNIDRWNSLSQVGTDSQVNVALSGSYTPTSSQSIVSGGANYAGVFADHNGRARPLTGPWSIGAVQL